MTSPPFYEADLRESGAIATPIALISAECHFEIVTEVSEAPSGLPLDLKTHRPIRSWLLR